MIRIGAIIVGFDNCMQWACIIIHAIGTLHSANNRPIYA